MESFGISPTDADLVEQMSVSSLEDPEDYADMPPLEDSEDDTVTLPMKKLD